LRIFWRVCWETDPLLRNTRDTVLSPTPAQRATSANVVTVTISAEGFSFSERSMPWISVGWRQG
jgi:hypothetical protein